MFRNAGSTNSDGERFETSGHPDGGCQHCGRETTAVPLTDFGLERGQLCPAHGIVDVTSATEIATDGGQPVDDDDDECDCDGLNLVDAGDDLECWSCFRERDRDNDRDQDGVDDAALRAEREHEELAKAEDRVERALERGDWRVGRR